MLNVEKDLKSEHLRVVSWNVNGLRSVTKKGFEAWLHGGTHSVVGIQELRAEAEQLEASVRSPAGWHTDFRSAQRKGYSGVGLFSKFVPDEVWHELGVEEFDVEGRVQVVRFGALEIWNVYFPNGNGKDRDLSRTGYKLAFYEHLRERLKPRVDAGENILVMGDFNTAFAEIDLARPKENVKTSGFRPEERETFGLWLADGWVDTFRRHHGDVTGRYSWWSQRVGVREKNIGWRIDYVLASPGAAEHVVAAEIHDDVTGSDHCPVSVDLSWGVLGADYEPKRA